MPGKLILVPTPIDEQKPIHQEVVERIHLDPCAVLLAENHREFRRRWLAWGGKREFIEKVTVFDRKLEKELVSQVISGLKKGVNHYLFSDCGLPGFCDPGTLLIDQCHNSGLEVTSTVFGNSVALTKALSGFFGDQFQFLGFPPRESGERKRFFDSLNDLKIHTCFMDTPYRLERTLADLEGFPGRVFLALDLNGDEELCLRGKIRQIRFECKKRGISKAEFVVLLEGENR